MKFVVAIDGSKPSDVAFTYLLSFAEKKVDEVRVQIKSLKEMLAIVLGKC